MTKVAVVSEPLKELVGEGKNAKYVVNCTELHLAGRGIEKIRGFERLVNLEVLYLNDNKIQHVTNLDNNMCMKELFLQGNQINTLKGCLTKFTFLETLELSDNNLRNLDRLLEHLQAFKFLKNLELRGNPCCEEPDYRLRVIQTIPSVHVLDRHVVTGAERYEARTKFGNDTTSQTIAFMKRIPPPKPMERVGEMSVLTVQLGRDVKHVLKKEARAQQEAHDAMFANALSLKKPPVGGRAHRALPLPLDYPESARPRAKPAPSPPPPPPFPKPREKLDVYSFHALAPPAVRAPSDRAVSVAGSVEPEMVAGAGIELDERMQAALEERKRIKTLVPVTKTFVI